jgi:hypothetical protein
MIKESITRPTASKPLVSQGFCGTHEMNKHLRDSVQLGNGVHGNTIIPAPTMGFEPWQTGQLTDSPKVGKEFAGKLTESFGDQAILSMEDQRLSRIDGYFFDGWESMGGDDFIKGRTLPVLGENWEMTGHGQYELKSDDGVVQKLLFRPGVRSTELTSSYVDNTFDTTVISETLRKAEDGTLRRETPPRGM